MTLPPFKNEPFTDFSTPENKLGMQDALAKVRAELGRIYDMKIGGNAVATGETFTSVNPARSTGPALFVGGAAMDQLWLFWVAPIIGAIIAGVVYPLLTGAKSRALSAA